jgi:hypothetical protein
MLLILVLSLLASFSDALTCQSYDNGKCVSVGCDVHCSGLGKRGGYCSSSGSYCTCNCISHETKVSDSQFVLNAELAKNTDNNTKFNDQVHNVLVQNYAILVNKTSPVTQEVKESCDCMYAGNCYSCGGQINSLACVKGCGWKVCTSVTCIQNACRDHSSC